MVEILKRNIKSEKLLPELDIKRIFTISIIDNRRMTLRWKFSDKKDVLINLTEEETEKLRECLK